MRIMEGQSFEVGNSGHWKKIEVEVDLGDFVALLSEWGVDELTTIPTQVRYLTLSLLAQQLLAYRVREAGGYTDSEYSVIVNSIKQKLGAVKQKVTS
jgi:hypothetical protein